MANSRPAKSKVGGWPSLVRLGAFSAVLALGLALVLTAQLLPGRYHFSEGDVVSFNIKSLRKVSYISQIMTKAERDRAAEAVVDVRDFDAAAASNQQRKADTVLGSIADIRHSSSSLDQKQRDLAGIAGLNLSSTSAREALNMDDGQWVVTAGEVRRVLGQAMAESFTSAQQPDLVKRLPYMVDQSFTSERRALVADVVASLLRPNVSVDAEATAQAREAARAAVQPVWVSVEKNEIILRDGDVVKRLDIEKLEQVGLSNPSLNWQDVFGNSLLVFLLVGTMAAYLYFFQPTVWPNSRRLVLVYGVLWVALLAAKLTIPGRDLFAYVFPVAAVPMLLATLLGVDLAVLSIAVLAPLIGLVAGGSLELLTASLVAGLVGVLGVWRMERQVVAYLAGLLVGVANFLVVAGFKLVGQDVDLAQLATIGFISLVNGGLSTVLTLGTSAALGHLFGITTTSGLLELAHPSQPLFRRLLTEAPGTYHHSVVVANLAERAAQQVGADSLLVRVGAYYHDIGKVVRPYCFVENQFEGQNVHDTLNPRMSAKLVTSHVRDGLQLAQQHGLPSKVRDIIEQHHGTKLAKFFYHRASQGAADQPVEEEDFRYPGPKPQSKEAAIVMLADTVEAALRSSEDHSAEGIARLVGKLINEMVVEGQLNECDLSLRDIDRIKVAFTSVMQGIFHPRVKYPEVASPALPTEVQEAQPALPAGGRSGDPGPT
ncbi:MAG: HDIG domain-containing protein [Chloroflexi bacterium]|nr:HDIG domain-containing protein [Chloroflexota bacterium]MCL5107965.1 HDIG domain-containing protein [Chloroflexota bacterium]